MEELLLFPPAQTPIRQQLTGKLRWCHWESTTSTGSDWLRLAPSGIPQATVSCTPWDRRCVITITVSPLAPPAGTLTVQSCAVDPIILIYFRKDAEQAEAISLKYY